METETRSFKGPRPYFLPLITWTILCCFLFLSPLSDCLTDMEFQMVSSWFPVFLRVDSCDVEMTRRVVLDSEIVLWGVLSVSV